MNAKHLSLVISFSARVMLILFFFLAAEAKGQTKVILLLQNQYNLKNYKYYPGDQIRVKSKKTNEIIEGTFYGINNSMLLIGDIGTIRINDVAVIYREMNWIRIIGGASFVGGAAYFGIDSFNRLINGQSHVIDQQTAIISGSMMVFGGLLYLLQYRPIRINEKWTIGILDFQEFSRPPQ